MAVSLVLLLGGMAVLVWWVLRDLSKGMIMRPAIGVLVLAALTFRVILSFRPYGR